MIIEAPYNSKISKIISLLAQTEKKLTKVIIELENTELEVSSDESNSSKLNSIKS